MKVPLNWIRQYTSINLNDEELIAKIRAQLGEVETVENLNEVYKNVLVAEVVSSQDIADSDKLAVYQLNIGENNPVQVVAGDRTLQVGDKVAYFPPGITLPSDFNNVDNNNVVGTAKLGGKESVGMMASAKELDLSNNHKIVMRLQTDKVPGTSFADVMDFNDTIIDIENKALANRADCFGVLGIAREIAGIQCTPFVSPDWYLNPEESITIDSDINLPVKIQNDAKSLCNRFTAISMSDIRVGDSPLWLQALLRKVGLRPVNNIVDITNYLMILTGQPMHAYDYDKILARDTNSKDTVNIVIRTAKKEETITTLDDKTVNLLDNVVVICDSQSPIGIGGIMGGLDTEIDSNTKNILLECANFDMYNVRRSSMRLGIYTDAVTRFSKGQDPNQCKPIIIKAVEMVKELATGKIASDLEDSYLIKREPKQIHISLKRLNAHLGTHFKADDVCVTLTNVELKTSKVSGDEIIVDIPTYRGDLNIREDIHEEVGRLYGYNKIQISFPHKTIVPAKPNSSVELQKKVRRELTSFGADEILTYNFTSQKLFKSFGLNIDYAYHLKNALSPELEYMRTSLLPSVTEKVNENLREGYTEMALFEINKSHNKTVLQEDGLPVELQSVALIFAAGGKTEKSLYSGSPYYMSKLYASELLTSLGVSRCKYNTVDSTDQKQCPLWIKDLLNGLDPNASAVVTTKREKETYYLGVIGGLSSVTKQKLSLPNFISGFELDLSVIKSLTNNSRDYIEPSKYPSVTNDFCFVVKHELRYSDIAEAIESIKPSEVLMNLDIVDIYQSQEQAENQQKQVTIRVTLTPRSKTLTSEEIGTIRNKVISEVTKKTGGEIKEN
ncbi:phenylalanine--tRNA ligase subunit beta [Candidatus Nomurabacteria bacterium]|nr:phenylalanine--tRNA ligase subunit beta [Candidatus Nomurabacteria bacterium]